jgi:adenosylcobinamide-phosphate synthase
VQLGGINFYFGKPSRKEIIGDHTRELEREDITRAQRLMLACSFFAMIVLGGVSYILRIL